MAATAEAPGAVQSQGGSISPEVSKARALDVPGEGQSTFLQVSPRNDGQMTWITMTVLCISSPHGQLNTGRLPPDPG